MVEGALLSGWLTPTSLFVLLNVVVATIFFSSSSRKQHQPDTARPDPVPQFGRAPSLFSRVASFNFSHHYPQAAFHDDQPEYDLVRPDPVYQPERAPSLLSRVASFNFCRPDPTRPVTVTREQAAPEGGAGTAEGAARGSRAEPVSRPGPDPVVQAPSLMARVASFKLPGLNRATEEGKVGRVQEEEEEARGGSRARKAKKAAAKKGGKAAAKKAVALPGEMVAPPREAVVARGGRWDAEVDTKAGDFINKFKQQLKFERLESLLHRSAGTTTA